MRIMKKSITLLLSLLIGINVAMADERGRHTIGVGTGVLTLGETVEVISRIGTAIFQSGSKFEHIGGADHNLYGEYKYSFGRLFDIGAVVAFNDFDYQVMEGEVQVGSRKNDYFCFALENNITYWRKGMFRIYGTLGVGMYHFSIVDTDKEGKKARRHNNGTCYQISPLCLSLGGRLGGYVELGVPWIGYKGMISGGVYYNF